MKTFISITVLSLLSVAACTNATQGSNARGGGDAGASSDAANAANDGGASQSLSCLGILQCAQGCASGDDACGNACVTKGSPEGQSAVTALAQCYRDNSCTDAPCIQTHCKTQLDACLQESQPPPSGQPSDGNPPPAGSVPASLVGSWGYLSIGGTQNELDFNADGTGRWSTAQRSEGTCSLTNVMNYTGNVVIDDTTITLYATKATFTYSACGSSNEMPQPLRTLHFTYSIDTSNGTTELVVTDQDCVTQQNGDTFYCVARYTRI